MKSNNGEIWLAKANGEMKYQQWRNENSINGVAK